MSKGPENLEDYSSIKKYDIPNSTLANIGKIAMLGSELDDLISLLIFKLSGINRPNGYLLVGRSGISAKLQKLDYLTKKNANQESVEHFSELKTIISEFAGVRNTLCHGVYIGKHETSKLLMFVMPAHTYAPQGGHTYCKMTGYTEEKFQKTCDTTPDLLTKLSYIFDGKSSPDIHRERVHKGPQPDRIRR